MYRRMRRLWRSIIFIAVFLGAFFYILNFGLTGPKKIYCYLFCIKKQTLEEKYGISSEWLREHGMEITSEIELEKDIDGDGLSLLEEIRNQTDPYNIDSDGDGRSDGEEVSAGDNPLGEGKLDRDNDKLPDDWEIANKLSTKQDDYSLDPDGDGLINYYEYLHLTNPQVADSDYDGYSDLQEIQNGYDPVANGDIRGKFELFIDKIKVQSPLVWSKSDAAEDMLEDLKTGVTIYPKTGVPGQRGNAVISGHSSNYVWIKGDFNYIFKDLNELVEGDEIIIRVTQKNGQVFNYKYIVREKDVVEADNVKIFREEDTAYITLVTCWPLGTNWKRLIVKAELIM